MFDFSPVSLEQVLGVIVMLAGLVPLLGGGVGAALSAVVDLAKAVALAFKRPLPDNWGGYLFTILNAVAFIVLAVVLGGNPLEIGLPDEWGGVLTALTTILASVAFLIGQFAGGRLAHSTLKGVAPKAVSTSYRAMSRPPVPRG